MEDERFYLTSLPLSYMKFLFLLVVFVFALIYFLT